MTDKLQSSWDTFIRVPTNIFDHTKDLKAVGVYIAISKFADNQTGRAFPSLKKLQEVTGLSRPSVLAGIKELQAVGALEKESGSSKKSNVYRIGPIRGSKTPKLVNEVDRGSKGGLPQVVKEVYPNYTHLTRTNELEKKESGKPSVSSESLDWSWSDSPEVERAKEMSKSTGLTLEECVDVIRKEVREGGPVNSRTTHENSIDFKLSEGDLKLERLLKAGPSLTKDPLAFSDLPLCARKDFEQFMKSNDLHNAPEAYKSFLDTYKDRAEKSLDKALSFNTEAIDRLNQLAGTSFKPETGGTVKLLKKIRKRWSLDEVFKVLEFKIGDKWFKENCYTPKTIFAESNFEGYLEASNQPPKAVKEESSITSKLAAQKPNGKNFDFETWVK
ncbi:MAG: conserved phage C-terminal domain-containing protein [Candidatus Peribacteraceae bacterium]|nr:conserved phage C-terminal domain-containing protein [Candidatus Peribacteraceae bacterium]